MREQLIEQGYSFVTNTDTEVVLAAYAHWGQACVEHFNGMWAFAIYDQQEQSVFLSRDHVGIKPLYYMHCGDYFAFASEIKQFTVLPGWQAMLNEQVARDFLAYGFVDHTEDTFFTVLKPCRLGIILFISSHHIICN